MEKSKIAAIRKDYLNGRLEIESVLLNPVEQFKVWFQEAITAGIDEPTAMFLATTGNDLQPSARIVLLKGVDENGFDFFTNYLSHKGIQIAENPKVAATFFWIELERQVRIEGMAEKLTDAESDEYFNARPAESRFSAAASPQSQVIPDRDFLEKKIAGLKERFSSEELKRPEHWGGYKIKPNRIEFWQGRENRLHDRLVYTILDGKWLIERLSP
jgi:pyridoxamine 5'-phosphate oxidase